MSSPPNHLSVTAWFARLDAAWRRMPAEERARQREEIEQHLEGLVAAKVAQGQSLEDAWEAALVQFGDPTQIGRKMYWEWQQGRTGFLADMKAILFGVGLQVLLACVWELLIRVWLQRLYNPQDKLYSHGLGPTGLASLFFPWAWYALQIILNTVIGRKYPFQAVKSAFYADTIHAGWQLTFWLIVIHSHPTANILPNLPWLAASLPLYSLFWACVAYLASVTKRGWYRPTLADFRITLPRRRFNVVR